MNQFRMRLTVIFILLIGLSVLAAGLFMANMLERSQMTSLKESMTRELEMMRVTTPWKGKGTLSEKMAWYNQLAAQLKQSSDARLTFIQRDGVVLGDSDHDPQTMENHIHREEILQARTEGVGYAVRRSATLHVNMLYVAIPIEAGGVLMGYYRISMSLHQVDASIYRLWTILIAGLLALFLIAVWISYRIAYGLTKPLSEIVQTAGQISLLNYHSRVNVKNKDEIGQLGSAINHMAASLQQQMEQITQEESRLKSVLENMISGVIMIDHSGTIVLLNRSAEEILGFTEMELLNKQVSDVHHRINFTVLIEKCMDKKERIRDEMALHFPEERMLEINLVPIMMKNDEWAGILIILHDITSIRRLERMRSEFVANVSHELKTPIAAVKGYAETLLAGAMNEPETAKAFLHIIDEESDRLNRLISDILELSKIESKLAQLHFSPVDLYDFMGKTLEMMKNEANKKKIDLKLQVKSELYIEADEDRLRQILINLLSNGISYTPEGGEVQLSAEIVDITNGHEDAGEKVRITVSDTGIGIPKDDIPRIFERFYRVDKARSRSSGGTGLGLSIVKHLVDLHKGSIKVESIIGKGTAFIIELPIIQS